jgi:hypothetical protein
VRTFLARLKFVKKLFFFAFLEIVANRLNSGHRYLGRRVSVSFARFRFAIQNLHLSAMIHIFIL